MPPPVVLQDLHERALELSNRLPSHFMKKLAENLWVLPYSLRLFGGDLRRVVTIVRLRSGELVIHSTGPFTPGDVTAILRLGKPGWLPDAMLRHDTFAKQGREAFPRIPFSSPGGLYRSGRLPDRTAHPRARGVG